MPRPQHLARGWRLGKAVSRLLVVIEQSDTGHGYEGFFELAIL